jgi:flagellar motor switch protein FliM
VAEVLSQKEIDELLASFSEAQVSQKDGRRTDRPVRAYDFRRPDKFAKEHIRTIQMLHDTAARLLTTAFSGLFRTMTQVGLNSVDQLVYSEFTRGLASPSILAVLSMPPLPGNCMLDISPGLAIEMIDRLLGGGGAQGERGGRALTEIEQVVMQKVVQAFTTVLREAWQGVSDINPRLEGFESNPMFTQIVAPNETCLLIAFMVRLGQCRGLLNLCLPFVQIERILPKLSAQHWFSGVQRAGPEALRAMAARLEEAPLPISVELGRARLSLGDLRRMAVGDVIALETPRDGEVLICVENKPKFVGRPGTIGNRLAIQIVGASNREEGVSL